MRKAPQERKTSFDVEHDGWENVRLDGDDEKVRFRYKVGGEYKGFSVVGRDGIEQVRDFLDAWIEYNDTHVEMEEKTFNNFDDGEVNE